MSEDLTRNLPQSFEERVLAELAAIKHEQATQFAVLRQEQAAQREMIGNLNNRFNSLDVRLNSLEEKVDARLRETRPIWEAVEARLTGIESEVNSLNRQIRSLNGLNRPVALLAGNRAMGKERIVDRWKGV